MQKSSQLLLSHRPLCVDVSLAARNLCHQSNVEGRFAAQVQPLFWNLHRPPMNVDFTNTKSVN